VITVPTPIDRVKRPDLTPLEKASATVGQALKIRAAHGIGTMPLVIYESTVYPGATEEVCVPVLESDSALVFNQDFCCGYSPERINPGDSEHKLTTIIKVTSGSTPDAAAWVDGFYGSIIEAGTHLAPSLKVAEAAKVIENTQRDLNIALVNELAIIFRQMDIDTLDVLAAAGTKWNFLPFRPGLVGGHCIGVDPYYLTYKAESIGYHPQIILAGRRLNDEMGKYVVNRLLKEMVLRRMQIVESRILIMGFSFKENCPDLRNTKVVDVVNELECYGCEISVYDPLVSESEAINKHRVQVINYPLKNYYDVIIIAVAHNEFRRMDLNELKSFGKKDSILYDLKDVIPRAQADMRL